jgi:hypothetical protein
MPIRPENRRRYPADWREISQWIRFVRAGGRCECEGECGRTAKHLDPADGRCRNRHGQPAWKTGSTVVLTTAHRNHQPEDCRPENLFAGCQGCHLAYDHQHHLQTRRRTAAAAVEQHMDPLFELPSPTTMITEETP